MKENERKRDFGHPDPKRPHPDFGQYQTREAPPRFRPVPV